MPIQVLISDSYVDVRLRDGLTIGGDGRAAAGAGATEATGWGAGGASVGRPRFAFSYRARLLPHVDGGDLVELLASHNTVGRSVVLCVYV